MYNIFCGIVWFLFALFILIFNRDEVLTNTDVVGLVACMISTTFWKN